MPSSSLFHVMESLLFSCFDAVLSTCFDVVCVWAVAIPALAASSSERAMILICFIRLFLKSFDTHVEQLLNEFVFGFSLESFDLCGHQLLLSIFQTVSFLAEFVDVCGVVVGCRPIRIILIQSLIGVKFAEPAL